jgi:tight adherence protein C
MSIVASLLQVEVIVTILAGLAAFGTVISLAAPMFEGDKLKSRIKIVAEERERLKQQQKNQLAAGQVKLRDVVKGGIYVQLVEGLNLRKVFEAETTREKLRQGGFRSERHLVTFLALRIIVPIVFGILTFVYTSTVFADRVPPNMRIISALIGLLFGFYMPAIGLSNFVKKRQASIKSAWSDARLVVDLY